MRTFIKWHNITERVTGLPTSYPHWWIRPVGGTCEADRQAFTALSTADKIAQSTTTPPLGDWTLRTCGTTPADDIWVPNTESGDSFEPDETTPVTPPTTPIINNNDDQAGWEYLGTFRTNT